MSEMARASKYDRNRVQAVRLVEGGKLPVGADFSAALGSSRIVSATWTVRNASVASISGQAIEARQRRTSADLAAASPGCTRMVCQVETDDGASLWQEFMVEVEPGICAGQSVSVDV